MSTEIARRNPPVVTFSGGPRRYEADRAGAPPFQVAYDTPANTLDPRYEQCTDHHVACDCREAELAEQINEYRQEWRALRDAVGRILDGHEPYMDDDRPGCMCHGCQILRAAHLPSYWLRDWTGDVPF